MNLPNARFNELFVGICRRYRVERLYLFGSAADGPFDSERSDLDFLVVLEEQPPGEYATIISDSLRHWKNCLGDQSIW